MAVGESIVIWGAGKKGKGVVQKIRKGKIKYFIDSDENKIGRYWCGIEIKSVENLYNEDKKTILVYTIENEAVKTIVKKWGGKSYSLKDFFSLPNIIKEIDEDYPLSLRRVSVSGKTEKRSSVTTTISLISWIPRDTSSVKRMRPSVPRISMKSTGCGARKTPLHR